MNLRGIWNEGLLLFGAVFRKIWAWLAVALVLEEVSDITVSYFKRIDERFMISGLLFVIAFKLLLEAFVIIVVNQVIYDVRKQKSTNSLEALRTNTKYVFIESTRAIVPVLLKLLLFVVPGLVEAVRLYFVPYVAQFDLEYKAGRVDALMRSREIVKGAGWPVAMILAVTFLLSMAPSFWLGSLQLLENPFRYVMVFFLVMVMTTYADTVAFCLFERLTNRKTS